MKKTLSIILASVIIISSLVVFALPAVAEQLGSWDVKFPEKYNDPAYQYDAPLLHGYNYDDNGFHTLAPSYNGNYNTKFTVVSRTKYDIKNFSMTVVIKNYILGGDNWISFSAWSDSVGVVQGDTSGKYGDGWTSLIRPNADGIVNRFESWNQTIGGRSGTQRFNPLDDTQMHPVVFEPIIDEETGDFTITFAITDGVVTVNGTPIGSETDACIADRFKDDGEAYFSVTLHNTGKNDNKKPAISLIDVNGEVPYGSDLRYPERIGCFYPPAPYIDPYLWFDSTLDNANSKLPEAIGCDVECADNSGSFLVTPKSPSFALNFDVRDGIAAEATEFPYIAMIFKNFCSCVTDYDQSLNDVCSGSESGTVWYCAGNITSPTNSCHTDISKWYNVTPIDESYNYSTDDKYTLVIFPIQNELWKGSIYSIRLDITGYNGYTSGNSFELMGLGIFRDLDETINFVADFRGIGLNVSYFKYEPPACDHIDYDGDGICDICCETVTTEETTVEETTVEETTVDETTVEETTVEETTVEETTVEETTVEETTVEVTTTEKTTVEETTVEETTVEVTTAETTTIEETSIEETTVTQESAPNDWDLDNDGYCDHCSRPYLPTEETSSEVTTAIETTVEETSEDTSEEVTEAPTAETTTKEPQFTESQEIVTSDTSSKSSGCKSSASIGIISIVAIIGSAALIKKKED